MIVDYDIAKDLNLLGFHCKSFWVYVNGSRTYTGFDGFDEGEFDFLGNNFLDPAVKKDLDQLYLNKQWCDVAYPQKEPEVICAPEQEDVILWLDTLGYHISIVYQRLGNLNYLYKISFDNITLCGNRKTRLLAIHDAIKESLVRLKRFSKHD